MGPMTICEWNQDQTLLDMSNSEPDSSPTGLACTPRVYDNCVIIYLFILYDERGNNTRIITHESLNFYLLQWELMTSEGTVLITS